MSQETVEQLTELVLQHARDALDMPELSEDDNFFEAGGDSIAAVHVIESLREASGIEVAMADFFTAATLGELGETLAQHEQPSAR